MITKLTPEQEAQLKVFTEKWSNIGLSTESANRAKAETGIHSVYKSFGLKPPKKIIWFGSPQAMYQYNHQIKRQTYQNYKVREFFTTRSKEILKSYSDSSEYKEIQRSSKYFDHLCFTSISRLVLRSINRWYVDAPHDFLSLGLSLESTNVDLL